MTVKEGYLGLKHFFEIEVWRTKISSLPVVQAFFYRQIRIWIISFAEFKKDRIIDKASALTYFTLLSIVPVIAMAFGVAKGFGLEEYLVKELERLFSGQEAILNQLLNFSKRMIETAHGGVISGISFLFLIYAVLRLMNNIEVAFNEIWDTRSRSWQRKVADYIAIILLGPLFIILSSSITVLVTQIVEEITSKGHILNYFRPFILASLHLIPFFIISFLLVVLYLIFPNTRVKILPAVIAGLLAGVAFQLTQWAWINGQVYLSKYNAIYGTFAALPLFMIYLQFTWLIVLFGAEYAFANQNVNTWEYKNSGIQMSLSHRRKLTLLTMHYIIKNFQQGEKALGVSDLSALVHVPYRFISNICTELEDAGLINKVIIDDVERYQPAMDITRLDIVTIFQHIENIGFNELNKGEDQKYKEIELILDNINNSIKNSKHNIMLKDLS
jgi:membrane protein